MTITSPKPGPGRLVLAERELRRLARWAGARHPRESCGCLLGSREGGAVRVRRVTRGRNTSSRARDRYELDPRDLVRAEDGGRARGLEVVGVWHSHPDRPAEPSEADRAGALAASGGWSHVIVSVDAHGVADVRSWRLRGDAFVEEELR